MNQARIAWHAVESVAAPHVDDADTKGFVDAARALLDLRIDDADRALQALPKPPQLAPELADAAALVRLLVDGRRAGDSSADAAIAGIRALLPKLADGPTTPRALHQLGALLNRRGRGDEADDALAAALAHLDAHAGDEGPLLRAWIGDSCALLALGRGAFEEARFLLERLVDRRVGAGDAFGAALSASHLGTLHVARGRTDEALHAVSRFLDPASALNVTRGHTRLRLLCVRVEALLESQQPVSPAQLDELVGLVDETSGRTATRARACVLGARIHAVNRRRDDALRLIERGADIDGGADPLLHHYWRARIEPDRVDERQAEAALDDGDAVPTESELRLLLLLAERAAHRGDLPVAKSRLDRAFDRAAQSTQPEHLAIVEEGYGALDPRGLVERSQERFSGRRRDELQKTSTEEATMVFADMVGFSTMSTKVAPEVVMSTVRGLFEHAGPLLARTRVRPLQHMGDGLLAIAQGPSHRERGLQFARDFVRRIGRAGRVRKALGEVWAPQLRAGVATGNVVLGILGSSKLEYLAIGKPTNLAARLQGEAKPGEVAASKETEAKDGVDESAKLKGWDDPVAFTRICVTL